MSTLSRAQDASEALTLISSNLADRHQSLQDKQLDTQHVAKILDACLDRNSVDLCLSIFRQMFSTLPVQTSQESCVTWPTADFDLTFSVVLALTRRMKVNDALEVMQSLAANSSAADEPEIVFGQVISSPMAPEVPLTVVQPQEGSKTIACSTSRYLFEVFSGSVSKIESEYIDPSNDALLYLARLLRIWRSPSIRAIHELVVRTPSGNSRTFRFGTESSDVPAKIEDRVSVVCTPSKIEKKNFGVFSPIPPDTRLGEPLTITNHSTSTNTKVIRAPPKNTTESIPGWVLPTAIVLAGSDLASSVVDPNLPLMGAALAAAIGASVVVGNTALLPRLKQMPAGLLGGEGVRQELLGRHQSLTNKIEELRRESADDIRALAKLWQLESKMTSVGSAGKYEARIRRIGEAKSTLQRRLRGRLELMHGCRRVANMIEIEVEMDVDVAMAEVEGIEEQLSKLEELESIQEEVQFQADAQEEVEKLLRSDDMV